MPDTRIHVTDSAGNPISATVEIRRGRDGAGGTVATAQSQGGDPATFNLPQGSYRAYATASGGRRGERIVLTSRHHGTDATVAVSYPFRMFRFGQEQEPPGPGGVPAWYDPRAVRAWADKAPGKACNLWRADTDWRKWLASRSGDPSLAQQMPARCAKQQMASFSQRCRVVVQKDRVLAFSACPLPEGGSVTLASSVPLAPIRQAVLSQLSGAARGQPPAALVGLVQRSAARLGAAAATKKLARASTKLNASAALRGSGKLAVRWEPALAKHASPFLGAAPLAGPRADKLVAALPRLSAVAQAVRPELPRLLDQAVAGPPAQAAVARGMLGKLQAAAKAGDPRAQKATAQLAVVNACRQAQAVAAHRRGPGRPGCDYDRAPVQFRREVGPDGKLRMVIDVGEERDATCTGFAWTAPASHRAGRLLGRWSPGNLYAQGASA